MIHEVEGDILLSKAKYIAHGVAPNDSFTHGLALALRERWPAMHKDFRHHCHQSHPQSGGLWTWGAADGTRFVNLMTQEAAYDHGSKPGKARLDHVNHCLRALRELCVEEKIESLALPRLATGVGGLEWHDVRPLIVQHLADLATHVFVYTTYRAGQAADETAARASKR